jgi:hypothetical protein
VKVIGVIVALGLLLVSGSALYALFLRSYDRNVQDIPFFRTMAWGFILIIALVAGIGGVAIFVWTSRSSKS